MTTADPILDYMAEAGHDVLHRLNVDFADAVVLIGQTLGGRPGASATTVAAIDAVGVDLVATDAEGEHPFRVDFPQPLDDAEQLTMELFGLLTRARELSGDAELTTAEQEMEALAACRTFVTSVVATEMVHPHLKQITFGGGDLVDFTPLGPDTFLYVLLPPPGRNELTIDQSFSWETVGQMPSEDQPVGAYYTLRRWRPEAHELDMLFVLHGDSGPASAWATRATPGDPVALWGPRQAFKPPADTDWYLLVADDTGLPAVAGILESLPEGSRAKVFAEVDDEASHQPLPERPGVEVQWLHRDGAEAGTTTLLLDAVCAMEWPEGRPYVWGGGESRNMTAIRKHVRNQICLEREAVSLIAYWRHSESPVDPGDD